MSWNSESLWAKACIFAERAIEEKESDELFGLWSSFALEVLIRSVVSSVSPVLLADYDKEYRYILYALGKSTDSAANKSIGTSDVIKICTKLFEDFTKDDGILCQAIINRRNDELHTGSCAFIEYPSSVWLSGYYKACKILCKCLNKNLSDLFGVPESQYADQVISDKQKEVTNLIQSRIAAHKKVFAAKDAAIKKAAEAEAASKSHIMEISGHVKKCPACNCLAIITGENYGKEKIEHSDGKICVRQSVNPKQFSCSACGLKLSGYGELDAAGMGGRYTNTRTFEPNDYYGFKDSEHYEREYDGYNNE